MALLIPAGLALFGSYTLLNDLDVQQTQVSAQAAQFAARNPTSNRWTTAAQTNSIVYRQPVQVIPDVDVYGVPRYLVDYGSGALTVQYTSPEFVAGNLTQY